METGFKNTNLNIKCIISLLAVIFIISSCSNEGSENNKINSSENGMRTPPVQTLAKKPITPNPDSCPPPYTIVIPPAIKKIVVAPPPALPPQTIAFNNGKVLKIVPPETKTADFSVSMKNFNTEQGLALSSVRCSYMDKAGNLWFGTYGGGVSKYDGKSFTNYNSAQGLVNNNVWSITEDKNGNYWFGTLGAGVSKYDGKTFTNYSTVQGLADNYIFAVLQDKTGNIWFATDKGVSRMSPDSSVSNNENPSTQAMHEKEGVKSRQSLFTNFNKTRGFTNDRVFCIAEDKAGNLWFGTLSEGVYKYDGKIFKNLTKNQGLPNNSIRSIMEDKKGNLWFGTNSGGLSKYDPRLPSTSEPGSLGRFTNFSTDQGLASNYVLSTIEDKYGNIWICTDGGGVSKYDELKSSGSELSVGSFTNFTTAQGLANNNVPCVVEDKAGSLWFGSNGDGLSKYDGESLISFTTDQGLANNTVFGIFEDRSGNYWFGTQGDGVSKYVGRSMPDGHATFTNYTTAQGLAHNYVSHIVQDKTGSIWFATQGGGVSEFDGETFTNYTTAQGLVSNYVSRVFQDKKGNLWFCTDGGGISKYNREVSSGGKVGFTSYTTAHGLSNNNVWSVAEDKTGNLWFCTNGGGVSKFDGKYFTTFSKSQGLANNHVLSCIMDRKGNLWFGTDGGGVSKYNGKSFRNYSTVQGLPDAVVYAIVEDTVNNMIWMGTNLGISGLKMAPSGGYGEEDNENIRFEIFNFNTGYSIKDLNTNALFVDSKGVIWGGTGDKLVRFDYKKIHKSTEAPNILIQSIKVNNEKICWNNLLGSNKDNPLKPEKSVRYNKDSISARQTPANVTEEAILFGRPLSEAQRDAMRKKFGGIKFSDISPFYYLPENLVLPYQHNNIEFDFAAIETGRPNLVLYQYMLEGYDNDWSPLMNKTTAAFGNIHEGGYTFKIKAKSPDGIWSREATYTFKVLPPLHRTWWAYCIYLIILSCLLYYILRFRTASLRRDKEILEHTVIERTAEAVMQKEEAEKQKSISEQKNLKITDSINYAKQIQQAILPSEEVISHLLPDSFIFFKPKDIVSGDFYWAHVLDKNQVLIAVVDCTGHGVPGAFMSIMGYNLLEQAVNMHQTHSPSIILNDLSKAVVKSLKQTKELEALKDGMDIALCKIDFQNLELEYAGAHNSLYLIRNGVLTETKADRRSIGISSGSDLFTNHKIKLQKGDCFYIFSDGYVDQKGGADKTKFFYRPFRELLTLIHIQPMKKQKAVLDQTFESWKGTLEQMDDVTIIGVRI